MTSLHVPDVIQVHENNEGEEEEDLTSELLPGVKTVNVGFEKNRRRSCLEALFCRRKIPSVRDSLAIVGLKSALLVGMLSNIGGSIDDDDDDDEYDDEVPVDAEPGSPGNLIQWTPVHQSEENRMIERATHSTDIDTEDLVAVKIVTSSEENRDSPVMIHRHSCVTTTTEALRSTRASQTYSFGSMSSRLYSYNESTSMSNSVSSSEENTTTPDEAPPTSTATFATMMFARDAPKLRAKDMLSIPLTVPPSNTPPPKIKYTIAGVKRGEVRRKSFRSGRSYISIQSSSSETLVDPMDKRIIITPADRNNEMTFHSSSVRPVSSPASVRRHSHIPVMSGSPPLSSRRVTWDRRYSMNPNLNEQLGGSADSDKGIQMGMSYSAHSDMNRMGLEEVKAKPRTSPLRRKYYPSSPVRQDTLQVPPFQPSFSPRFSRPLSLEEESSPMRVNNSVPTSRASSSNRPSQSSHASSLRRRQRAQQLKRQKSIDISSQHEDSTTEESSTTTTTMSSPRYIEPWRHEPRETTTSIQNTKYSSKSWDFPDVTRTNEDDAVKARQVDTRISWTGKAKGDTKIKITDL